MLCLILQFLTPNGNNYATLQTHQHTSEVLYMHKYPCLLSFNERTREWLVFFLTVLLTDGPEGAEENVTHQQSDFHDASSSLNCSIPLKHQTPSAIRRMRSIDFPELRALRMNLFFAGVHTKKQNKTKRKQKHPSDKKLLTT